MRDNQMVERVALALCNAYRERDYQTEIDSLPEAERQDYLSAARRAIEAMRDLTVEMTTALTLKYRQEEDRYLLMGVGVESYHTLIDAALKEEPKP